jgi:hypothetical protein
MGIEVKEDYASEIGDTGRENGLLVSDVLTITRQTAQRGLDIFEKSL